MHALRRRHRRILERALPAALILLGTTPAWAQQVRQPAVAGQFYPANAAELKAKVQNLLDQVGPQPVEGTLHALWAPHAGVVFSGPVAAQAYRGLKDAGQTFDVVVIVAPSHRMALKGVSVAPYDAYRTPLGDVPVQRAVADRVLAAYKGARAVVDAHRLEHAVEVQLPFIQTVLPGVPIVPIVVGDLSEGAADRLAEVLVQATEDRNALFVASSDLSHYPSYADAVVLDRAVLEAVERFDLKRLAEIDEEAPKQAIANLACALCGWPALSTVMRAARRLDATTVKVMPYLNSGDVSGNRDRVVGYGAALFSAVQHTSNPQGEAMETIPLTPEEETTLFQIARSSIEQALMRKPLSPLKIDAPHLLLKRGVFVTLTRRERLRGCIGLFDARYPLAEAVREMAVAAATQDYRFAHQPVTLSELPQIEIKISILSDRRLVDSIDEIEVGRHGVWVEMDGRGGTYLPEVAVEQGWDRIQLLEHLCAEKAGLPRDAYRQGAKVYVYTSQVLSEK